MEDIPTLSYEDFKELEDNMKKEITENDKQKLLKWLNYKK